MNDEKFRVTVLTTPEYLRILRDEQLITVAVIVEGKEVHHQFSVLEYDTREKIEKKMAELGVQTYEELTASGNVQRGVGYTLPQDIQSLVDEHIIK